MSKSAQSVAQKFVDRASAASQDYLKGAQETSKDQSALAIAAIPRMQSAIVKAITSGRVAKGLQASGKSGWLKGIADKGANRFAEGVSTSMGKYAVNSGKYDGARNVAANMPTGEKGSATNLAKVAAVVSALRTAKVGSTG